MANQLTPSKVFVPGGMPSVTYVPRTERDLEARLESASDNLCKLVTLTGSTKSGKTVLANKVFPRSSGDNIWIDGGAIDCEDTFWREIHAQICQDEDVLMTSSEAEQKTIGGELGGEGGFKVIAKASAKGSASRSETGQSLKQIKPVQNIKARTLRMLRDSGKPLIVDDFHYIERKHQGPIVRALKPLVFEGHPVVFIAIPHRRYDVVRVEKEMTGRVLSIPVPSWSAEELYQIASIGFPKLGMAIDPLVSKKLAAEAYGSPHLMQEFCREVALDYADSDLLQSRSSSSFKANILFKKSAEATGKIIFDKLATGPRQRTDRMQRPLSGGGTADIYRVILLALSHLRPGLNVIDYEALRSAIRSVLSDNIPQANEVTRVLEKMAEIAAKDESSVAVIDWDADDQKLHITDPFFAFFLKWSEDYIRSQPLSNGSLQKATPAND